MLNETAEECQQNPNEINVVGPSDDWDDGLTFTAKSSRKCPFLSTHRLSLYLLTKLIIWLLTLELRGSAVYIPRQTIDGYPVTSPHISTLFLLSRWPVATELLPVLKSAVIWRYLIFCISWLLPPTSTHQNLVRLVCFVRNATKMPSFN